LVFDLELGGGAPRVKFLLWHTQLHYVIST